METQHAGVPSPITSPKIVRVRRELQLLQGLRRSGRSAQRDQHAGTGELPACRRRQVQNTQRRPREGEAA